MTEKRVEIVDVYDRIEALDVITRSLRDYEAEFGQVGHADRDRRGNAESFIASRVSACLRVCRSVASGRIRQIPQRGHFKPQNCSSSTHFANAWRC